MERCSGVVSAATEGESQSPLGQPAVRLGFGFHLRENTTVKGARARALLSSPLFSFFLQSKDNIGGIGKRCIRALVVKIRSGKKMLG